MIKNHFTVGYRRNRQSHTVLGVTSIVPNLNGILMFTEDGENHFIEQHELLEGDELIGMYISYAPIDETDPTGDIIHDHRAK